MLGFIAMAQQCAPVVDTRTMAALVRVESSFNPFAIGVVNGVLKRQPRSLQEAVSTAQFLEAQGYNYSVGLAQVNRSNFRRYGLSIETAFQPCLNLSAGSRILADCFTSARGRFPSDQHALRAALSCYYSGNYTTGFRQGYVQRVVNSAGVSEVPPIPVVPAVLRAGQPLLNASGKSARPAGKPARGRVQTLDEGLDGQGTAVVF